MYVVSEHIFKSKHLLQVLMCLNLTFIVMALSVVMFNIVPDYTTFGSQHYVANVTVNGTQVQVIKL
jgi:hypothetical protein